jgi:hypothetical protein
MGIMAFPAGIAFLLQFIMDAFLIFGFYLLKFKPCKRIISTMTIEAIVLDLHS